MISTGNRDVDEDRQISCPENQIFEKSQTPNSSKHEKRPIMGFQWESGDHALKVASDHGVFAPIGRRFSAVFWFFLLLSSLTFLLEFLHMFWHDFPAKNLTRSHADQRAKFLIFRESRRLVSCRVVDLL